MVFMASVKFGVQFKQEFESYDGLRDAVQSVYELGFVSAWLYDHLYPVRGKPNLESWTTLSALAADTEYIRLGTLVSCNAFRYPQLLVKMASTVDVISNGRLEFGIGMGWYKKEHLAYGIPFPDLKTRTEQLEEALQIIKGMWAGDRASFQGKHYFVQDVELQPKPIQKPHPPIWIGGNSVEVLALVAKYGNASNLVYTSPEESRMKNEFLSKECRKQGRDYDSIVKSWHGHLYLSDDAAKSREEALERKRTSIYAKIRALSDEEYLKRAVCGTSDQCIDRIQEFVDAGISCFIFSEPSTLRPEPRRFSKDVMPSFA